MVSRCCRRSTRQSERRFQLCAMICSTETLERCYLAFRTCTFTHCYARCNQPFRSAPWKLQTSLLHPFFSDHRKQPALPRCMYAAFCAAWKAPICPATSPLKS